MKKCKHQFVAGSVQYISGRNVPPPSTPHIWTAFTCKKCGFWKAIANPINAYCLMIGKHEYIDGVCKHCGQLENAT